MSLCSYFATVTPSTPALACRFCRRNARSRASSSTPSAASSAEPRRAVRRRHRAGPGRPHPHRGGQRALHVYPWGKSSEFGAGLKYAVEKGWIELHESGTYVRLLTPGEDLLAQ